MKTLTGTSLAGMSPTRERVANDFYATPFNATEAILKREKLFGSILEPAAGQGHISKVLKEFYPYSEIVSTDLISRDSPFGIDITPNVDFLTYNYKRKFDNIITNTPFKFAKEFILRSLELANEKVIMFAKIQLLEGQDRLKMWENTPIKTIYVFSKRVNPMRNGSEVDEKGKPWASTMCFAWFVWEHNYEGLPTIEWI